MMHPSAQAVAANKSTNLYKRPNNNRPALRAKLFNYYKYIFYIRVTERERAKRHAQTIFIRYLGSGSKYFMADVAFARSANATAVRLTSFYVDRVFVNLMRLLMH